MSKKTMTHHYCVAYSDAIDTGFKRGIVYDAHKRVWQGAITACGKTLYVDDYTTHEGHAAHLHWTPVFHRAQRHPTPLHSPVGSDPDSLFSKARASYRDDWNSKARRHKICKICQERRDLVELSTVEL